MNLITHMPFLIRAIKAKKEIQTIDDMWIVERIIVTLIKQKKIEKKMLISRDFAQFSRSREYEALLKTIRADLHAVYGTFQREASKRRMLFSELKKAYGHEKQEKIIWLHEKMLATHTSTKERLNTYPMLYKRIFALTGTPKTLLDVSCGLNPFSYPWMECTPQYIATEITGEDCQLIKDYFSVAGVKGEVHKLDLIKEWEQVQRFTADVCFLWKVLDTLEYMERGISQKILPAIDAKYLVVSFSTKTLSGKPMKKKKRWWLENICKAHGWEINLAEIPGELFYVVKK